MDNIKSKQALMDQFVIEYEFYFVFSPKLFLFDKFFGNNKLLNQPVLLQLLN